VRFLKSTVSPTVHYKWARQRGEALLTFSITSRIVNTYKGRSLWPLTKSGNPNCCSAYFDEFFLIFSWHGLPWNEVGSKLRARQNHEPGDESPEH